MIRIDFPSERELYAFKADKLVYIGDGLVAPFELLWASIDNAPAQKLTKNDWKTLRKLKVKLREVSEYKDGDRDSRILQPGGQSVNLQDAEFNLLKQLLEGNQFVTTRISDTLSTLWDIIDSAQSEPDPKPVKV